tara:strand:- start:15775 stop:16182 length:408 start_codon:yes stop_codon:yes gene_type:complete
MSRIEDEVCEKIQARSDVGKAKYGTNMERTDLSNLEWLNHLQEELMDGAVYAQKVMEKINTLANAWVTFGYDGSEAGCVIHLSTEPDDPLEYFGSISDEEREDFIEWYEDGGWEAREPGEWNFRCMKLSKILYLL